MSGFVVLPRRWVVERTFAWLMRYRRLVRCYERRPAHHEAMLLWATVHLMTRRLARELAGLPPAARWDAPPPLPELASPDRRGKILELLAAQPWRTWRGVELATILGITNINSFRVQLSQWAHQGSLSQSIRLFVCWHGLAQPRSMAWPLTERGGGFESRLDRRTLRRVLRGTSPLP
jgi:hypothetical protein